MPRLLRLARVSLESPRPAPRAQGLVIEAKRGWFLPEMLSIALFEASLVKR
jgi:hypothetical protein